MTHSAICIRCGGAKELALARCPECGLVPIADERAHSLLASSRFLGAPELAEVQRRIRAGEPLRPARERVELARTMLAGSARVEPFSLSPRQAAALVAANVLLTPALGYAVWFGTRHRPGLGARQALWLTLPVSFALALAWGFFVVRSAGA
ncbi:MAG: hypothetical protein EXR69_05120 [Myxococcales bacterium]|nr:hypothetical protein [Myxococcales bacterium]